MWDFVSENFFMLFSAALVFADVVVSLTKTEKDDRVVGYIRVIFTALFGSSKIKKSN